MQEPTRAASRGAERAGRTRGWRVRSGRLLDIPGVIPYDSR